MDKLKINDLIESLDIDLEINCLYLFQIKSYERRNYYG